MKKTRVAVVGVGVMGSYHANVYASLPQTELVAVVDPCLEKRIETEIAYDINSYQNHFDLLANENIDAISLATPTSLHFDIAKDLLKAGKHLLIEKPISSTVSQAQELIELSEYNDLVLQVGHITRFYKAIKLLKEKIKAPYLIEARRLSPNGRIVDVGVILDLMIHDIDIVLSLIDSDIVELSVSGQFIKGNSLEDVASAHIQFENGCIVNFLASRAASEVRRNMDIFEKGQTIKLDFSKAPYTELVIQRPVTDNFGDIHVQTDSRKILEQNPLQEEISHFLARIRDNVEPIGTTDDDLRSLKLARKMISMLEQKQSKKDIIK